jgi:hypothetical protein
MKRLTVLSLLLAALLAFPAPSSAAESPAVSDVVIGFTGGAVWTSAYTGICVWFLPLVGDEPIGSLFDAPEGVPIVDREHAYFVWVSDFSVQMLPAPAPYALALVPAGTGTIYYTAAPTTRAFGKLTERSSWGVPVAKFVRKASLIRSPDGFASDTFVFSTELVESAPFSMANGKKMDFKNLVPNGMTCYEYGLQGSSWESGVCLAKGK